MKEPPSLPWIVSVGAPGQLAGMQGEAIALEVADNGIGIAAADLRHIYGRLPVTAFPGDPRSWTRGG